MASTDLSEAEVSSRRVAGVLNAEYAHLGILAENPERDLAQIYREIHALPETDRPAALCLSGGGIRSATFSLGVLQWLATHRMLSGFHYLSTVSGGGYVGSLLSALLRNQGWNWERVAGSLAGNSPQERFPVVKRLRAFSNYLSPVAGLSGDGLSLIAIFVRNFFINAVVWLALGAGLFLCGWAYLAALQYRVAAGSGILWGCLALFALGIAFAVADICHERNAEQLTIRHRRNRFALFGFVPFMLASIGLSILFRDWVGFVEASAAFCFFDACRNFGATAFLLTNAVASCGVCLAGVAGGCLWRRLRGFPALGMERLWLLLALALGVGAVEASVFSGALLYLGTQNVPHIQSATFQDSILVWYAILSVPLILTGAWLAMTLYTALCSKLNTESEREWLGRASGYLLGGAVLWSGFVAITVTPEVLRYAAGPDGAGLSGFGAGVGGGLLGAAVSAWGFWSRNGETVRRKATGLLERLGLSLQDGLATLTVVVLFYAMSQAVAMLVPGQLGLDTGPQPLPLFLVAVAVVLVAAVFSAVIGVNNFSLHSMYGNRLVRAYLGACRAQRHPHWFTGFDPEDNISLKDLKPQGGLPQRLFPVLNMALNMVRPSAQHLDWQQRKAASFIATPLHCGADCVGYAPTARYGGSDGMSLGRAMTISGAAASPNMGYHSSAAVTFLMALFNVRLGWWQPSPALRWEARWGMGGPLAGLFYFIAEACGLTRDDQPTVYLSDGGHFENTGLYEMVRRRCHRIVVVDCGCDPDYQYDDLVNAIRKIRVDFNILIDIDVPALSGADSTAQARVLTGTIHYPECDGGQDAGLLYIIKPRLLGSEPPDIAHYARTTAKPGNTFPQQTTADQFFDESQFESYRELGCISAASLFASEAWQPYRDLDVPPPPKTLSAEEKDRLYAMLRGGSHLTSVDGKQGAAEPEKKPGLLASLGHAALRIFHFHHH